MTTLTMYNAGNSKMDKETIKAQKQWVKSGSVSETYLRSVLGDISKSVSVLPKELPTKKSR